MSQVKTAPLPIELVQPTAELGAAVHKLISECPPQAENFLEQFRKVILDILFF